MAIFKKLSVGDTVASSGTRVFKKLTTDAMNPTSRGIVGTWVFNDTLTEFPIFDDTVEDSYNENYCNLARYINVDLAYYGTRELKPNRQLAMYNLTIDAYGGETVFLGSQSLAPIPFYYYETNTYRESNEWSENAYNELTFLATSTFTNYSGVDVSDKFYEWLKANATKKDSL